MQLSKSKRLPLAGLVVFIFFIALSYFNNHMFLDKIVLCSLIVGMIFFVKIRGEGSKSEANSDLGKYPNLT